MPLLFISHTTDPYFNAATEEYLLKEYDNPNNEPILFIWQNDNTIFVGRNQNTFKEINLVNVKKDHVNLVRRFSGGGTVYQDLGNLCYTIIDDVQVNKPSQFAIIGQPVVDFLQNIGVNAVFHGRNDIEIDGKKISGNAQYLYKKKLLQHGTLMFNVNFELLNLYLTVDPTKIAAKGIDSIRKRVTNIVDHLSKDSKLRDVDHFKKQLCDWFIIHESAQTIELDEKAKTWIANRAKYHFSTWEWNYGETKEFSFINKKKFPGGLIEVNLQTNEGKITDIKFYGDFLSVSDLSEILNLFIGVNFEQSAVNTVLEKIDLSKYFGTIQANEILELMFDNGKSSS
ncbi:lipoate--protein ligase [[Mycoplasma] testudinis]|uniref:lipoate--protein ligase n=1 Tax=[Mycoplasma] testudinis TaxID=33924 RepID=UPI00048079B4|nr:lipoate--protein ligase [[Mycoplasma] testudinis]